MRSGKLDRFWLDHLTAHRKRRRPVRTRKALRRVEAASRRIRGVKPIHVLEEHAARLPTLGQKKRRQIRTAAPEQRRCSFRVAPDEAREHHHCAARVRAFDRRQIDAHRLCFQSLARSPQVHLRCIEDLMRNASAIER